MKRLSFLLVYVADEPSYFRLHFCDLLQWGAKTHHFGNNCEMGVTKTSELYFPVPKDARLEEFVEVILRQNKITENIITLNRRGHRVTSVGFCEDWVVGYE